MSDNFKPQNIVQYYAWTRRQITEQAAFEKALKDSHEIARVTARSWWVDGVPENMYLSSAKKLAEFLYVKVDDLLREQK